MIGKTMKGPLADGHKGRKAPIPATSIAQALITKLGLMQSTELAYTAEAGSGIHGDPISHFPFIDLGAYLHHHAAELMSQGHGRANLGVEIMKDMNIRPTDACPLNLHHNLILLRKGRSDFNNFNVTVSRLELSQRLHGGSPILI
jgi:hypothetical protein